MAETNNLLELYKDVGLDVCDMLWVSYKEALNILEDIDRGYKNYNPSNPTLSLLTVKAQAQKLNKVYDKFYAGITYFESVEKNNPLFDTKTMITNIDELQSQVKDLTSFIDNNRKNAKKAIEKVLLNMDSLVVASFCLSEQYVSVLNTITALNIPRGNIYFHNKDTLSLNASEGKCYLLDYKKVSEEYKVTSPMDKNDKGYQEKWDLFKRLYEEEFIKRFPENTSIVVKSNDSPYLYILSKYKNWGEDNAMIVRVLKQNPIYSLFFTFYNDDKERACYMGQKIYSMSNKFGQLVFNCYKYDHSFEYSQIVDALNDAMLKAEQNKEPFEKFVKYLPDFMTESKKEKDYEQGLETS